MAEKRYPLAKEMHDALLPIEKQRIAKVKNF